MPKPQWRLQELRFGTGCLTGNYIKYLVQRTPVFGCLHSGRTPSLRLSSRSPHHHTIAISFATHRHMPALEVNAPSLDSLRQLWAQLLTATNKVTDFLNCLHEDHHQAEIISNLVSAWDSLQQLLERKEQNQNRSQRSWSDLLDWYIRQRSVVSLASLVPPPGLNAPRLLNAEIQQLLGEEGSTEFLKLFTNFLQHCNAARTSLRGRMRSEAWSVDGEHGMQFETRSFSKFEDNETGSTTIAYTIGVTNASPEGSGIGTAVRVWRPTMKAVPDVYSISGHRLTLINSAVTRPLEGNAVQRVTSANTLTNERSIKAEEQLLWAMCKEAWGEQIFRQTFSILPTQSIPSLHDTEKLLFSNVEGLSDSGGSQSG